MATVLKGVRLEEETLKEIDELKLKGETDIDYIRRAVLEKLDKDRKDKELFEIKKAVLERGEN